MNVDTFKLTADTLQSVHKERDPEEIAIYAQLFRELEEVDLRITRTRRGTARERGRRPTPIAGQAGRGPAT